MQLRPLKKVKSIYPHYKESLLGKIIRLKCYVDTFKFRNKIGIDTATEALREYMERKDKNLDKLMNYAEICRVCLLKDSVVAFFATAQIA